MMPNNHGDDENENENNNENENQAEQENDQAPQNEQAPEEGWKGTAVKALKVTAIVAVGAAGGGLLTAGSLWAIGLSSTGPVAGGVFASNMGAGLVAGSWMSSLQSAAMTGYAYYYGAGAGAAIATTTARGMGIRQ